MAVRGTKPKPEGQARNRNKPVHDWTEVVDTPHTGGPKLPKAQPDGRPWPLWTKRWWDVLVKMPHCSLWSSSDWEFAFDTAVLKAKFHTDVTTALATEIRNREKVLGTTADFRRDLRIRYVEAQAAKTTGNVTSMDDYRDL